MCVYVREADSGREEELSGTRQHISTIRKTVTVPRSDSLLFNFSAVSCRLRIVIRRLPALCSPIAN